MEAYIIREVIHFALGGCFGFLAGMFFMFCSIRKRWPDAKKAMDKEDKE